MTTKTKKAMIAKTRMKKKTMKTKAPWIMKSQRSMLRILKTQKSRIP